jgi:protease I
MLELIGYQVDIVSPGKHKGDSVKTAIHDFIGDQTYCELQGHRFSVTAEFDSVNASDYNGLYIPGGRAPEFLRQDEKVLSIVQYFLDNNKPLGIICHGPLVLSAIPGACKGRKLTAYTALKADMVNAGADWQDVKVDEAVVDRNLVTAVAWPGHAAFIREFVKLMGSKIEA